MTLFEILVQVFLHGRDKWPPGVTVSDLSSSLGCSSADVRVNLARASQDGLISRFRHKTTSGRTAFLYNVTLRGKQWLSRMQCEMMPRPPDGDGRTLT